MILIAIRTTVTQEMILFDFFPGIDYEQAMKLDYFSFSNSIGLMILLYERLTERDKLSLVAKFLMAGAGVLAIFVIFNQAVVFSQYLVLLQVLSLLSIVYVLSSVVVNVIRKPSTYAVTAVATAILVVTIVNDILLNLNMIQTREMAAWGFIGFTILMLYRTAEQLRRAYDTIHEYSQQLEEQQMMALQQGQLSGIGHLAAGLAHEINNPVGFAYSNLQMLAEDKVIQRDDLNYEMVVDTLAGLKRVQTITKNLLLFSGYEHLHEKTAYYINEGIENVLFMVRNYLSDDTQISKYYSDLPLIMANGGQINQAFLNIMLNAIDAMKNRSDRDIHRLIIRTKERNGYVWIEIVDNGIGIPDENASMIFNPFYTTKPVGEGVGMGLAMTYDIIVNRHHGEIKVDSKSGEGTKVTVKIPIA